jgi:hypothetical protein
VMRVIFLLAFSPTTKKKPGLWFLRWPRHEPGIAPNSDNFSGGAYAITWKRRYYRIVIPLRDASRGTNRKLEMIGNRWCEASAVRMDI